MMIFETFNQSLLYPFLTFFNNIISVDRCGSLPSHLKCPASAVCLCWYINIIMKSYETLKEYVCVDCQSKTNYKIVVNQLTAITIISLLLEPLFVVSPAASDSGHFYHLKH